MFEIWVVDDDTGELVLEYGTDDWLACDVVADWCKVVDLPYMIIENPA